jgi:hypothetical protein
MPIRRSTNSVTGRGWRRHRRKAMSWAVLLFLCWSKVVAAVALCPTLLSADVTATPYSSVQAAPCMSGMGMTDMADEAPDPALCQRIYASFASGIEISASGSADWTPEKADLPYIVTGTSFPVPAYPARPARPARAPPPHRSPPLYLLYLVLRN